MEQEERRDEQYVDTILMLSGGVDSTYCAWDYLRKNPNKDLLLYHIDFNSWEGRREYELKAVDNIIRYFKENGLDNFQFYRSHFDYGDVGYINYDVVTFASFTGNILRIPKFRTVKYIITSTCLEEANSFGGTTNSEKLSRHTRKEEITKLTACRGDLEWYRPIAHLGKKDMLEEMPEELVSYIWYCRRPTPEGLPCQVCHTCKYVNG